MLQYKWLFFEECDISGFIKTYRENLMKLVKIMSGHISLNVLGITLLINVHLNLRQTEISHFLDKAKLPNTEEWFDHVAK